MSLILSKVATEEAIAIFLLVYFIIDFVRRMISLVTASGSGMCGVLAFVLFFH